MAITYKECSELRISTRQNLTSSKDNWLQFLSSASNTYKYKFDEQLLIFAQFPQAKACASFNVWSNTFGRKINRNTKGIALIDDTKDYPKLKYVFDISSTSVYDRNKRQPYIWTVEEQHEQDLIHQLSGRDDISLQESLKLFVEEQVDSSIDRYMPDILREKDKSTLSDLDETSVKFEFRQLLTESVTYMAMKRCGLDTSLYFDDSSFSGLYNFSDLSIIDILGSAVSDISEQVLRETEQIVKTTDRRINNERTNAKGQDSQRYTVSSVRGGYDILSDNKGGRDEWSNIHTRTGDVHIYAGSQSESGHERYRQMGQKEEKVSSGEQTDNVYADVRQSDLDRPSDRSQRGGGEPNGIVGGSDGTSRRSDGRTESSRPNEMGTNDELNQSESRRNSSEQFDLRINENTEVTAEEEISPAVFDFPRADSFEQVGFFDNEKTGQDRIDEYIISRLMSGTGTQDGKFHVNEFFSPNHTEKEKADFLKDEFGWYGSYNNNDELAASVKGLSLIHKDKDNPENNITVFLKWNEVSKYIDSLVEKNEYITQEDIDKRIRNAKYVLSNYKPDNDYNKIRIQDSKKILDSYNIDYSNIQYRNEDNINKSETKAVSENDNNEVGQVVPSYEITDNNNYHITDNALGVGKLSEKYLNNINAIKTLKAIEEEKRTATKEEQEVLSKYVGWGGLSSVFQPEHKCYSQLKNLLTDSEYEQARRSTNTAFYTSPVIIREMYNKLAEMGFNGGRLLEPSCGAGNFIGSLPENINAKVTGIELDSITGRIAKQLYPNANIQVCGFENSNLKENSFDVAVGNVPFGDIRVYDKKYNKDNLLIHDYFFSKSLDMVKNGGIVAFITSKGTLDKKNDTARRLIAEKAEFLGAVRLPNNAFKANAGTDVTSDIIFLKKRTEPLKITLDNEPLWLKTSTDENGIEMNAYFAENPQQICGTMEMTSTQYGTDSTCVPDSSKKLSEQIRSAMSNINGTISTIKDIPQENVENSAESVDVPSNLRNSSFFLSDSKPYFYENGSISAVELSKKGNNLERLAGLIAIRDTVRQLLDMQLDENTSDDEIKTVQSNLSSVYDDFVSKYGLLNSKENVSIFKNDSSLPLIKSLEKINQKGEFIGKADIFSKRTIKAQTTVTSVPTSVDALAISMSETAKVDLDYMQKLTGFNKDKIVDDLKGLIFLIPDTDKYVTANEYLSGNILQKLENAQKAFDNGDNRFADNIEALKNAMPKKLDASEIDVRLGATWIDPKYIKQFVYELLNTPLYHRISYANKKDYIDVQYSDITGKWFITNKSSDKDNILATTTYGTKYKTAYQLIEDTLNLKSTTVKKPEVVNGKEQLVIDRDKTAQVQTKQDLIKEKFKQWVFADKNRRDDIVDTYNKLFNTTKNREYDGKYLNFVGMNPEIELRPHQLNAVARCLYGGNTLLAHEVGAGKTFEMIAVAMEGKRLGLHNKSLFCVPNHLTEQIGADFLKLYPNANILVATKKDFEKQNRKNLMAKISTGNYDAVIIGHSQLSMIPVSSERQQQFIEQQIDEIVRGIQELETNKGERFQIKQMEKTKQNLEVKLQKLLDTPKDDTVTFEQLGVDKLFLDEAHEFKNLFLTTKMTNVSGVSTSSDVQKTADLFMKTQYLDELTNGKGLVFATGTPVSNSMCEIYNMMKYLQSDLLKNKNLYHFDSWASTFGENVTQSELAPEGKGYRMKTRFAKFYNLPELMAMFKECADIQTAETLKLPGIPKCEIHNISVEPTEMQKELVESLSERATKIHNREVEPHEDNMLKITNDGKKIGLDQRLINPDLPDEPGTKVNVCVDNVFDIWDRTKENKSTQLIFCDTSTPKGDGTFNLYDDIKNKLVSKGIPSDEIAFIHDAATEEKKEQLFSKVRAGDVRVLIGSTKKMGAGTNVQDKLVASHDLDAPYKPSDMEQRRGRMVRQGNQNKKVDLYRYCTKDTFDAYLFQMLERKQKFISQIMTSKSPQRRCDDIDEAALSYAEVKALCVGDPRIKEKMELDVDVAKLQLERSNYQQEQYNLEDRAASIQRKITVLKDVIPKNQSDFMNYKKNHPIVFDKDGKKVFESITINGTTFTDKKEAAEELKKAYIKACSGGVRDYVPVGKYKDFDVSVMFDPFLKVYKASLTGEASYYLELGTDNFTRMDNVLDKLENMCKDRISSLEKYKKDLKEVQSQIGKPFEKEAEYQSKTARLSELNRVLDVDGKKNEIGGVENDIENPKQNNHPKR